MKIINFFLYITFYLFVHINLFSLEKREISINNDKFLDEIISDDVIDSEFPDDKQNSMINNYLPTPNKTIKINNTSNKNKTWKYIGGLSDKSNTTKTKITSEKKNMNSNNSFTSDINNLIIDPEFYNNTNNFSGIKYSNDSLSFNKVIINDNQIKRNYTDDNQILFKDLKCGTEGSSIFMNNSTNSTNVIFLGPKYSLIDMSCLRDVNTIIIVGNESIWNFFKEVVIKKNHVIKDSNAFLFLPKRVKIINKKFENFMKIALKNKKNRKIKRKFFFFSFKQYDDSFAMRRILQNNIKKGSILIVPDFSDSNALTLLGLNLLKCFKFFKIDYLSSYEWREKKIFPKETIISINQLYTRYRDHKLLRSGKLFKNELNL